jgi:endonuclease/exonuclease/phosphatase family metal-dependent hydrolase
MRFLTYNLWHGLSPSSVVAFEALEPKGRRELRENLQVHLLRDLKPDVAFLQEVNPSSSRAAEFSDVLEMTAAIQPDLVGLKLFGVGLPLNLNSGLVTLAGRSLGLKKLEGLSLSRPGTHRVHSWGSWQLQEERFALFCEAMLPRWGRVLLVDTHLHHGLEATPEFLRELDQLCAELELSENIISELKARLAAGGERRQRELEVLLGAVAKHQKRYEVIVIGGDFNARPDSEVAHMLIDAGFRDVWAEVHPEGGGLSFDGTRNEANHRLQENFPLTMVVEDLSFSAKVKESLLTLARTQERRPRRIDQLWLRSNTLGLRVERAELVGLPNAEGLAPSDHFGVCADIELV